MTEQIVKSILADFAERDPDWMNDAIAMIEAYPNDTFVVEEVREFAKEQGLRRPPGTEMVWGAVVINAKKRGLVEHCGFRKKRGNSKSHAMMVNEWRKVKT